jgi:hypothetical protein
VQRDIARGRCPLFAAQTQGSCIRQIQVENQDWRNAILSIVIKLVAWRDLDFCYQCTIQYSSGHLAETIHAKLDLQV